MAPNTVAELLKLPLGDRAELDRRFAERQANPASARSWDEVENLREWQ